MLRNMSLQAIVEERIRAGVALHQALLDDPDLIRSVTAAARIIVRALQGGRKLLLFGNGGSAADAQHIAAELVGRYLRDRSALPAIALTTNPSSLTAIANDHSFDQVFARQIEALGRPGDVALGISTSGNSRNVVVALKAAKRLGLATLGLTGSRGGALRATVDCCIAVPSRETPRIQEAHILIGHIICEIVERAVSR